MPRGYRGALIAAFGWLILAAAPSPNNGAESETENAAQRVSNSIEAISRSQAEQAETGEYQAPCEDGQYNNRSDLCAQWYAARAAGESARWSFWTFWLSIGSLALSAIGLVALYITIGQGRTALKRARKANRIARETALAADRPWISYSQFEVVNGESVHFLDIDEHKPALGFHLAFVNTSTTPAIGVKMFTQMQIKPIGESAPTFLSRITECPHELVIPSNKVEWSAPQWIIEDDIEKFSKREICIWLYTEVQYRDPRDVDSVKRTAISMGIFENGQRTNIMTGQVEINYAGRFGHQTEMT